MVSKVKVKKSVGKPTRKVKAPVQRKGRTSTSRLSSKNQLTVPVDILRRVGLVAGDEVEFVVNNAGFIEVRKYDRMRQLDELAAMYGDLFANFNLTEERKSSWPE
jgi:bifunctional DNA-binding transcriptional regulator/antitoxin component of YhaV-PrlF toxin-antitoxin module